jgi:ferredoxin-type protein NapH
MVIESIPKIAGIAYALIASFILFSLFYYDKYNKNIGYLFLISSITMGFLVFAPMFPYQFQLLILGTTRQLGGPLPVVIVTLVVFVILTLIFGRLFCGFICPIGTLQELAYHVKTRKLKINHKTLTIWIHLLFFIVFLFTGIVLAIGLLTYLGVRAFFYLNLASWSFYLFLALVGLSAVVYRPFCRFFCPYGFLLSLASIKGIWKMERNESCIDCGKCESICPTQEAGKDELKQECYLCNRCKEVCPVAALEYRRKETKR